MIDDERDRLSAKRDRTARFYRVVTFLEGRGERGATPTEIAQAVGMSKRTAYRDLVAIQEELLIPIWEDGGRYGLDEKGLLPALRLTQAEAMAVFLSARLMARYSDAYDPDLAAAFQKLAVGAARGARRPRPADVRPALPAGDRRRLGADDQPAPDPGLGRAAGRRDQLPRRDLRPVEGIPDRPASGRT